MSFVDFLQVPDAQGSVARFVFGDADAIVFVHVYVVVVPGKGRVYGAWLGSNGGVVRLIIWECYTRIMCVLRS